jgi:TRAP-type C4-dicarboxylate transport system permease small subunit
MGCPVALNEPGAGNHPFDKEDCMRLLKVLNRPVTCHRFLTVFCSLGMLVSTVGAVSLLVRWPAHLDLNRKLMLLVLFVFGLVWFLKALRSILQEMEQQNAVTLPRAA